MKKIIFSVLPVVWLLLSGCSDSYYDINTNPNAPASATPELILTNALNVTANRLGHHAIGNFFGGYWAPSGSYSGFFDARAYDYGANYGTGIWSSIYDNLQDYQAAEEAGTTKKWAAISGITKVMKAFNYQILVDTYNNVPYSEALKGTTALRPKYDDAQAIYDDLSKKLDEAVTDLKAPITSENPTVGVADIFFKGDLNKWIRFANTLKLRLMLRQTNLTPKDAAIKSEIAKAAANGGFLGIDENVLSTPGYLKTAGKQNPFWESYGYQASGSAASSRQAYVYSDFLIKTLVGLNDDRLPRLATKNSTNEYRGVPLGEGGDAYLFAKNSWFGPAIMKAFDQPMVVMTAAESFFLQAEAVQRGYLTGDAKKLYETGIAESFKFLGVPDASTAAAAYAARKVDLIGWDSTRDKIEAIITQKWIAMTSTNGFEAWTEYRRTGFPNIPLATRAIQPKQPARLFYPTSELIANSENVAAQGTINQFDSKIFWMKK